MRHILTTRERLRCRIRKPYPSGSLVAAVRSFGNKAAEFEHGQTGHDFGAGRLVRPQRSSRPSMAPPERACSVFSSSSSWFQRRGPGYLFSALATGLGMGRTGPVLPPRLGHQAGGLSFANEAVTLLNQVGRHGREERRRCGLTAASCW